MNQVNTESIILKRVNYNEADRILTVLTKDKGRVSLIAKGVRKQKSKHAGGIELLSISEVSYIVGKSDLYTLTSARLAKHFSGIVGDIERTMLAYRFLEIINKITDEETGQEFFDLLSLTLESLDTERNIQILQIWFYLRVLRITGHAPNLSTDSENKKLEEGVNYNFDIEAMRFIGSKFDFFTAKDIKLLRLLIESHDPKVIDRIKNISDITVERDLQLTKNLCKFHMDI